MVLEVLGGWPIRGRLRFPNRLAVEPIIFFAIRKLFLDPRAYNDTTVCRINRNVPSIEEAMEVASHQKPVGHLVALMQVEGSDMSGVKHRQCPLPC